MCVRPEIRRNSLSDFLKKYLLKSIFQQPEGYRSIRMRNGFGEVENCLATLLVHVKIESKATGQEKYHSKNDLQFVKKNYQDLLKIKEDKIKSKRYLNLILI